MTSKRKGAGAPAPSGRERGGGRRQVPESAAAPLAPAPGERGPGRRDVAAILALGLLLAVSFFPAARAGFIWDDFIVVTSRAVQDGSGLWRLWFEPGDTYRPGNTDEDHYWPVLYTSFWLEHKLWGFAPAGYHLVNLLLHFVNALLVWRLLLRFAVPGAWVAAAVFAVHPLQAEAVVWIIARKDLLSGLFYLAAALTYLRFVETPRPWRYLLALVLYAAGLLSKSIAVTLPAALLLLHWWERGRVSAAALLRLLPFFLVGLGVALADLAFIAARKVVSYDYSLVERVLIAARALWFYTGKLLWPAELVTIYPRWDIDAGDPLAWGWAAAAAAAAALLWRLRRRTGRGPLTGVLFFVLTLSPVLGFVDFSWMQFTFVADRYQYLAGLGVTAVLIAAAAGAARRRPPRWRALPAGLAGGMLIVLGALSWRQAEVYRDEVTFFRHVVAVNPGERAVHMHLGKALAETRGEADRLAEAEKHYRRALEIDPGYLQARQNLAELFRQQQRFEEAVAAYRAVIEADPGFALAHAGMGTALLSLQRRAAAVESMHRALSLRPELPTAPALLLLMGRASRELGRAEAAAGYYERALRLRPRDPELIDLLARLRFEQERYEEALTLFRTLARLRPGDPAAHTNVGAALFHLGRPREALRSLDKALSLDPENRTARDNREQVRMSMEAGAREGR